MKILIFNWRDPKNPKSGGAEIVTLGHAKAWIKAGHEVTWFSSKFKNALKKEKINGVRMVRMGNSLTVYLFAPFFYLTSTKKYDVIIDQIHGMPFFTPIYVRKPKIAFIHEVAEEIWDHTYSFPLNKIGRLFESFYFKFYKNIQFWTDAKSTINDLENFGIKRSNCLDIPCPINNKVLKKIPAKEKTPTFIFVSRIVKMKGIEDTIKAFVYILKSCKNAKFLIIGKGEKKYIKRLKSIINNYRIEKNIEFLGCVSDKEKIKVMQKAHLLLHASIREGWGLVVIEAASQATPSIVYGVSGLRDSVKNKKTGIVLDSNSPEEMAKQALALINNKKKYYEFQLNCLTWAKSLSWGESTRKSLNLLKKVINN